MGGNRFDLETVVRYYFNLKRLADTDTNNMGM